MHLALLLLLMGQDGVRLRHQGGAPKAVRELNCVGPGVNCSATSTFGTIFIDAGAGLQAAGPLYLDGGSVACGTASGSSAGCLSSADWATFSAKESALTFNAPLSRSTNTIGCTAAAENTAGCITGNAAAVQDLSGIFVFKQRLATRGSLTYDAPSELTASMDVSAGIAVDGPVFPNADGNQLRLTGRRTDLVSGIRLEAQRWIDGGIIADVPFPWPCNNAGSVMSWTPEGTYFGGSMDRTCSGTGSLYQGALVDNGGVGGHYTMMAGNPLSLIYAGNLNASRFIEADGGRPVAADYNTAYNSTVVGTESDGGTFFWNAARHGDVIATSRTTRHQGWIFEVENPERASGSHIWGVTYWGSMAPSDQIPFSEFPAANAPTIVTSGGQYVYSHGGELAHDRRVADDESTGHWRNRHIFADAGAQWVTMVDTSFFKAGSCQLDGASPSKCSVTLPSAGAHCSCSGRGTSAAVANAGCAQSVTDYVATFYSSNGLTHFVDYVCASSF